MARIIGSDGITVRASALAAHLTVLLLAACAETEGPAAAPVTATLEEVFAVEAVLQLGEDPADSIAEIGDFVERQGGGYVIGDLFLPRVRSYDEEGRLEAAFGRFGDGPFEFRRINALVETPSENIVVLDLLRARLTFLTSSLAPDTSATLPATLLDARALGPDLLVRMITGDPEERLFARPPLLYRMTAPELELVWSSYERPFSDLERPYWGAFARFPIAVGGDSTFVMSGLEYPVTIIDGSGETVGTLGTPSDSFRPIPVLEQGAFANPAAYGTTLGEFLGTFDMIDRIDVVGRHLVLTRARFDPGRPLPPFRVLHTSLEVYDRHTGTKLYEDVPLPTGSKVLGGGRFLYLLLDRDFPPWRIAKLRRLTED